MQRGMGVEAILRCQEWTMQRYVDEDRKEEKASDTKEAAWAGPHGKWQDL